MGPSPTVLLLAGRMQVRGTSVQTLNLALNLPSAGFQAQVVCRDARQLPSVRRSELSITEFGQINLPVIGRYLRGVFAREVGKAPPDLIHIQQRTALPLGIWLALQLQRPYVASINDYLGPRESLPFDRTWARQIIAVSESVRTELLERTGLPEEMVTVIHSGVDIPADDELRPPFSDGQTPVVGTAGPLEAAKGLHFFLRAIPRVLAAYRPVEFLVAGAGPEERGLRRMCDDLGVTEFVTFVPNVFDLSTSLTAMDIYCLPSLKQGLGTIMLEAMARARPVIASSVGGVYSAIDEGETGLLVPPSDSDRLADRIVELLNDQDRARALGRAGRERVLRDFPVERMVEQTAAVYRSVLGAASP
jgi:glycosyltransferase involved in cell wall biosynthesis